MILTKGLPQDLLEYARCIADGMVAVHNNNAVHLDLKPDNVCFKWCGHILAHFEKKMFKVAI